MEIHEVCSVELFDLFYAAAVGWLVFHFVFLVDIDWIADVDIEWI